MRAEPAGLSHAPTVSKDKTPYKTFFCANHSRTGRKGPFAGYYLHLSPNGKSFLGCGIWSPSTDGLKAIRDEILRDPAPLRRVLAEPAFIEKFGSDKSNQDGSRTSIFGHSDQLKNAPKLPGVDKTHKDIDLLKCAAVPFLYAPQARSASTDIFGISWSARQVPLVRGRDQVHGR